MMWRIFHCWLSDFCQCNALHHCKAFQPLLPPVQSNMFPPNYIVIVRGTSWMFRCQLANWPTEAIHIDPDHWDQLINEWWFVEVFLGSPGRTEERTAD